MRTLTTGALIAGAFALSIMASPAAARSYGPGPKISWGKESVSLEDYWIDAAQCSYAAMQTDLAGTPPAEALVYASRLLENQASYEDVERAMRLAAPPIQWKRAADIMQEQLDACLEGRGYVRFKLTSEQAKKLAKLDRGTLERRRYLHSLASDPAVLREQALAPS